MATYAAYGANSASGGVPFCFHLFMISPQNGSGIPKSIKASEMLRGSNLYLCCMKCLEGQIFTFAALVLGPVEMHGITGLDLKKGRECKVI
jgi:hypothetical protein